MFLTCQRLYRYYAGNLACSNESSAACGTSRLSAVKRGERGSGAATRAPSRSCAQSPVGLTNESFRLCLPLSSLLVPPVAPADHLGYTLDAPHCQQPSSRHHLIAARVVQPQTPILSAFPRFFLVRTLLGLLFRNLVAVPLTLLPANVSPCSLQADCRRPSRLIHPVLSSLLWITAPQFKTIKTIHFVLDSLCP